MNRASTLELTVRPKPKAQFPLLQGCEIAAGHGESIQWEDAR